MKRVIRGRYLLIWLPVAAVLLALALLLLCVSRFGFKYQFREPVDYTELSPDEIDGAYITVKADTLGAQTFAFFGYENEAGESVIVERYCYLAIGDRYVVFRVTQDYVNELAKYDNAEQMIADGEIGSMLEIRYADISGTAFEGIDPTIKGLMRDWIADHNISSDGLTDKVTGADLSAYGDGDYSAYVRNCIADYTFTCDYWAGKPVGTVKALTVFALILAVLAVALLLTIPLGVWEQGLRSAMKQWDRADMSEDFRHARRFGKGGCLAVGREYVWWIRPINSRIMRIEDILWIYPRSLRLEGGKKSFSLAVKPTDGSEGWSVRLGEPSAVQLAENALKESGHPMSVGFDEERQKLFERDINTFRARVRNGTL